MDRRSFQRTMFLTAVGAPFAGAWWDRLGAIAEAPGDAVPALPGGAEPARRTVIEYELPPAEQTHEVIRVPGSAVVLVSQMSSSTLVKLQLDQNERVTGVKGFPLGPPEALLHGLAVSDRYPGMIWATHEGQDRLLLVDPGGSRLDTPPKIIRTIDVPAGGKGPHYVGEYGDFLWVTLKGSDQVLAISHRRPQDHRFYEAASHPIFIARHPDTGEFFASLDESSEILRIDADAGTTSRIRIPPERGATPVGLVAGPAGVWVVLLGTKDRGTGTFGRIDRNGEITWFRLTSPLGRDAGLLHLAFAPQVAGQPPTAWLLSSSIISSNTFDAIIRVTFDDAYTRLTSEELVALPTQLCKAHRLLR
ncbi:MAG: hypothetical protein AB1679_00025 [Actinomycetota bacterium]|jgi:virginiamycin B lyase